jgi:hypothetical protein
VEGNLTEHAIILLMGASAQLLVAVASADLLTGRL